MLLVYRATRWSALVGAGYITITGLPGLARYLKIRNM
jgi:hypothetical protein